MKSWGQLSWLVAGSRSPLSDVSSHERWQSERVGLEFCKRCAACKRAVCCHHTVYRACTFRTNALPSQLPAALPQTACSLLPFLSVTLPVDYREFDHSVVRDVWFEIYFLPLERLKLGSGQWLLNFILIQRPSLTSKLLSHLLQEARKVCCPHCSFQKNHQLYLNAFFGWHLWV